MYKDKGFTGIIPANTLSIGKEKAAEYYSWDASWGKKPDYTGFFTKTVHFDVNLPGGLLTLKYLLYADPIIFILGFFGLFSAFKQRKRYLAFLLFSFIPIWFYISSVIPLSKHLLFEAVLFAPLAGFGIENLDRKLKNMGIKASHVLTLIFVFQLIWLGFHDLVAPVHVYSKSTIAKFIDYKLDNIPKDALILFDGRIYTARANWMAQGRYYVNVALFTQISEQLEKSTSNPISVNTYFVECVRDDCGWGTIKDQPEFNQTMESFVEFFANISEPYAIDQSTSKLTLPFLGTEREEVFKIYKANLLLKPEIFEASEYSHKWYLYPLGYNEKIEEIFDKYRTEGIIDGTLDKLAHYVFYLALMLVFLSLIAIIYLFFREDMGD